MTDQLVTNIIAGVGVGYEVVTPNRTRRSYGFLGGHTASADRHLTKITLSMLRELCRKNDRETSLFSGILDRALDNIFGSNFDFVPKTGNEGLNNQVKDYIDARMKAEMCDASGVMDFIDIAKTAIRGVWTDGDLLMVKKPNGSMLTFEADQVASPTAGENTKGERIIQGVELNENNRPVGYWVKQRNTTNNYGGVDIHSKYKRVAAPNTIAPAYRKRFGQSRGVPYLASILGTYERFNNYLDFEQFAAEQNAMIGWKITRKSADSLLPGDIDNINGESQDIFEKMQQMYQGMMLELEDGEDVSMFGADRPAVNFDKYVIICCRLIGVGVGYPLELMLLDYSKTNYSSGRMGMAEAKRMFRSWQRFAGTKICLPWYKWQIARGMASGELPANPDLFEVRLQWPAWEMIDKKKEADGDNIAINNRSKSVSQCIRERGDVPKEVFEEIANEQKLMAELGISAAAESEPEKNEPDGDDQDNKEDKESE